MSLFRAIFGRPGKLLRRSKRENRTARLLQLGLFSPSFYLEHYPDIAAEKCDPLNHYLDYGVLENRLPSEKFDPSLYLAAYPDVAATNSNAMVHYLDHGWAEGRIAPPSPHFDKIERRAARLLQLGLFSPSFYLEHSPDVAAAKFDPLKHYLEYGILENRLPSEKFDPSLYLAIYPDVAAANISPMMHYLDYGWSEGRMAPPSSQFGKTEKRAALLLQLGLFSSSFYLQRYPDVAAAKFDLLDHYLSYGMLENRLPSERFDPFLYLSLYPDVAAAKINPMEHYLDSGWSEGRMAPPSPHFDQISKINKNIDDVQRRMSSIDATCNVWDAKYNQSVRFFEYRVDLIYDRIRRALPGMVAKGQIEPLVSSQMDDFQSSSITADARFASIIQSQHDFLLPGVIESPLTLQGFRLYFPRARECLDYVSIEGVELGCAISGPDKRIGKGHYRVYFCLACDPEEVTDSAYEVDVNIGKDNRVIGAKAGHLAAGCSSKWVALDFRIAAESEHVQFRAYQRGRTGFRLEAIRLEMLPS